MFCRRPVARPKQHNSLLLDARGWLLRAFVEVVSRHYAFHARDLALWAGPQGRRFALILDRRYFRRYGHRFGPWLSAVLPVCLPTKMVFCTVLDTRVVAARVVVEGDQGAGVLSPPPGPFQNSPRWLGFGTVDLGTAFGTLWAAHLGVRKYRTGGAPKTNVFGTEILALLRPACHRARVA